MGDTVVAHLAARAVPGIRVLFVDTGYHFGETLGTADAVQVTYPVRLLTVRPAETVTQHERARGKLYRTDPDACCAMRKVAPLDAALKGYRAWATGLRRDESAGRADTATIGWDPRRQMVKIAPIAAWTDADVDAYLDANPDVDPQPAAGHGLPLGGVLAVHPAGRRGRGRPGRPMGGQGENRMRHSLPNLTA